MTYSPTFNEVSIVNEKALQDMNTIAFVAKSIQNEYKDCLTDVNEVSKEETKETFEKVLSMTNMSIKMLSTSYYKKSATLDVTEVEQVKKALANFKSNNEKTESFKKTLIEDLTEFQAKIRINHHDKLEKLIKEKQMLQRKLLVVNTEKHKLIMERLSKIEWPYDKKTNEYDSQIASLEALLGQYSNKIETLKSLRPVATEKDILLYQMELKQKFAQG